MIFIPQRKKTWTEGERKALARLYRDENLSPADIARILDRKESTILAQIANLRLTRTKQVRFPWTRENLEEIRALHRSGLPAKEIALRVKRSTAAVKNQLGQLGELRRGRDCPGPNTHVEETYTQYRLRKHHGKIPVTTVDWPEYHVTANDPWGEDTPIGGKK